MWRKVISSQLIKRFYHKYYCVSYAFIRDNKVYLLSNGVLTEINERLKVKDSVVGYVVSEEGGKIRFTKVPIHDCSRLSYFSGVLRDYLKGSVAVFESSESACILFNPPSLKTGLTYDLVAGRVFLRGDKRSVMEAMDQYDVVKFALERYGDEEVKRRAVISLVRLDKCDEAISLYTSLKEKDPEESLAVAECYEKTGKELEALKIYSFFSEEKYRELESKLIAKADALVVEFEKQGNPKLLMEALNVLPTYDIPAVKLGLHYLNKNKVEEAVNMFEEALRRNRNFQNLVLLGSALLRKDPKRALEVLDEAQKIRRTAPLHT